jgi:hypothetical protein
MSTSENRDVHLISRPPSPIDAATVVIRMKDCQRTKGNASCQLMSAKGQSGRSTKCESTIAQTKKKKPREITRGF